MKKILVALVAGVLSVAISGAYAADKADAKKSDTGVTKSEKGMTKSTDAKTKDDDKKKKKDDKTTK